jgi:hypothetical protein
MTRSRCDDLSDIPTAAQKVFTCTEAARCAPERSRSADSLVCRFLPVTPVRAHLAPGTQPISSMPVQRDVQNDPPARSTGQITRASRLFTSSSPRH